MKLTPILALASSTSATYVALLALRPSSPIQYGELNANASGIWIGKDAASYCPPSLNITCPDNRLTVFSAPIEANGTLSMGVEVPGGQEVYIDPKSGMVSYTEPHSAAKPEGAIVYGWTYTNGTSFGTLSFTDGLVFCPVSDSPATPWQLYAALPQLSFGPACLEASLIAGTQNGTGAWEYL